MVQALQGYGGVVAGPVCPAARPAAQGVASPECSAPKRRAGPLRSLQVVSADSPSAVAASTSASWSSTWSWARQLTRGRLLRFNWKTVLAVLVVIMFPRLIALAIAITLRLVAKAVMSVASHVLRELWFQLNATAAEIEEALVDWLYGQLGFVNPYVPPPPLLTAAASPAPPPPPVTPDGGGNSLPARPMDLITCLLLVLNLRRPYGGGGGNGGPEG